MESTQETHLFDRVSWFEDVPGFGELRRYYKGGHALDGRNVDLYYLAIVGQDTISLRTKEMFPGMEIIDSTVLFLRSGPDLGFKHGWFKVERGRLVAIKEVMDQMPKDSVRVKYQYRNGMIYRWDMAMPDGFDLHKPELTYADVKGFDVKIFDPDCFLYKVSENGDLVCISYSCNYDLTKDGVYYAPYPGMVAHRKESLTVFRDRIVSEGGKMNELYPPLNLEGQNTGDGNLYNKINN